jgi:carbonic anhydrase
MNEVHPNQIRNIDAEWLKAEHPVMHATIAANYANAENARHPSNELRHHSIGIQCGTTRDFQRLFNSAPGGLFPITTPGMAASPLIANAAEVGFDLSRQSCGKATTKVLLTIPNSCSNSRCLSATRQGTLDLSIRPDTSTLKRLIPGYEHLTVHDLTADLPCGPDENLRIQARGSTIGFLRASRTLREAVLRGDLIMVEAMHIGDNDPAAIQGLVSPGTVLVYNIISAKQSLHTNDIRSLIADPRGTHAAGLPPTLAVVKDLILGNAAYRQNRPKEKKARGIFVVCSDPRLAFNRIFDTSSDNWIYIRNPGSMITLGYLSAVHSHAESLESDGPVYVGVITHTKCGANRKTLEALRGEKHGASCGCVHTQHEKVTGALTVRLSRILEKKPHITIGDPNLEQLAEEAAREGLEELKQHRGIRELNDAGRVVLVAGSVNLDTGLFDLHKIESGGRHSTAADVAH